MVDCELSLEISDGIDEKRSSDRIRHSHVRRFRTTVFTLIGVGVAGTIAATLTIAKARSLTDSKDELEKSEQKKTVKVRFNDDIYNTDNVYENAVGQSKEYADSQVDDSQDDNIRAHQTSEEIPLVESQDEDVDEESAWDQCKQKEWIQCGRVFLSILKWIFLIVLLLLMIIIFFVCLILTYVLYKIKEELSEPVDAYAEKKGNFKYGYTYGGETLFTNNGPDPECVLKQEFKSEFGLDESIKWIMLDSNKFPDLYNIRQKYRVLQVELSFDQTLRTDPTKEERVIQSTVEIDKHVIEECAFIIRRNRENNKAKSGPYIKYRKDDNTGDYTMKEMSEVLINKLQDSSKVLKTQLGSVADLKKRKVTLKPLNLKDDVLLNEDSPLLQIHLSSVEVKEIIWDNQVVGTIANYLLPKPNQNYKGIEGTLYEVDQNNIEWFNTLPNGFPERLPGQKLLLKANTDSNSETDGHFLEVLHVLKDKHGADILYKRRDKLLKALNPAQFDKFEPKERTILKETQFTSLSQNNGITDQKITLFHPNSRTPNQGIKYEISKISKDPSSKMPKPPSKKTSEPVGWYTEQNGSNFDMELELQHKDGSKFNGTYTTGQQLYRRAVKQHSYNYNDKDLTDEKLVRGLPYDNLYYYKCLGKLYQRLDSEHDIELTHEDFLELPQTGNKYVTKALLKDYPRGYFPAGSEIYLQAKRPKKPRKNDASTDEKAPVEVDDDKMKIVGANMNAYNKTFDLFKKTLDEKFEFVFQVNEFNEVNEYISMQVEVPVYGRWETETKTEVKKGSKKGNQITNKFENRIFLGTITHPVGTESEVRDKMKTKAEELALDGGYTGTAQRPVEGQPLFVDLEECKVKLVNQTFAKPDEQEEELLVPIKYAWEADVLENQNIFYVLEGSRPKSDVLEESRTKSHHDARYFIEEKTSWKAMQFWEIPHERRRIIRDASDDDAKNVPTAQMTFKKDNDDKTKILTKIHRKEYEMIDFKMKKPDKIETILQCPRFVGEEDQTVVDRFKKTYFGNRDLIKYDYVWNHDDNEVTVEAYNINRGIDYNWPKGQGNNRINSWKNSNNKIHTNQQAYWQWTEPKFTSTKTRLHKMILQSVIVKTPDNEEQQFNIPVKESDVNDEAKLASAKQKYFEVFDDDIKMGLNEDKYEEFIVVDIQDDNYSNTRKHCFAFKDKDLLKEMHKKAGEGHFFYYDKDKKHYEVDSITKGKHKKTIYQTDAPKTTEIEQVKYKINLPRTGSSMEVSNSENDETFAEQLNAYLPETSRVQNGKLFQGLEQRDLKNMATNGIYLFTDAINITVQCVFNKGQRNETQFTVDVELPNGATITKKEIERMISRRFAIAVNLDGWDENAWWKKTTYDNVEATDYRTNPTKFNVYQVKLGSINLGSLLLTSDVLPDTGVVKKTRITKLINGALKVALRENTVTSINVDKDNKSINIEEFEEKTATSQEKTVTTKKQVIQQQQKAGDGTEVDLEFMYVDEGAEVTVKNNATKEQVKKAILNAESLNPPPQGSIVTLTVLDDEGNDVTRPFPRDLTDHKFKLVVEVPLSYTGGNNGSNLDPPLIASTTTESDLKDALLVAEYPAGTAGKTVETLTVNDENGQSVEYPSDLIGHTFVVQFGTCPMVPLMYTEGELGTVFVARNASEKDVKAALLSAEYARLLAKNPADTAGIRYVKSVTAYNNEGEAQNAWPEDLTGHTVKAIFGTKNSQVAIKLKKNGVGGSDIDSILKQRNLAETKREILKLSAMTGIEDESHTISLHRDGYDGEELDDDSINTAKEIFVVVWEKVKVKFKYTHDDDETSTVEVDVRSDKDAVKSAVLAARRADTVWNKPGLVDKLIVKNSKGQPKQYEFPLHLTDTFDVDFGVKLKFAWNDGKTNTTKAKDVTVARATGQKGVKDAILAVRYGDDTAGKSVAIDKVKDSDGNDVTSRWPSDLTGHTFEVTFQETKRVDLTFTGSNSVSGTVNGTVNVLPTATMDVAKKAIFEALKASQIKITETEIRVKIKDAADSEWPEDLTGREFEVEFLEPLMYTTGNVGIVKVKPKTAFHDLKTALLAVKYPNPLDDKNKVMRLRIHNRVGRKLKQKRFPISDLTDHTCEVKFGETMKYTGGNGGGTVNLAFDAAKAQVKAQIVKAEYGDHSEKYGIIKLTVNDPEGNEVPFPKDLTGHTFHADFGIKLDCVYRGKKKYKNTKVVIKKNDTRPDVIAAILKKKFRNAAFKKMAVSWDGIYGKKLAVWPKDLTNQGKFKINIQDKRCKVKTKQRGTAFIDKTRIVSEALLDKIKNTTKSHTAKAYLKYKDKKSSFEVHGYNWETVQGKAYPVIKDTTDWVITTGTKFPTIVRR